LHLTGEIEKVIFYRTNIRAAMGGKAGKAWSLEIGGLQRRHAGEVATTMAALPAKNLPWRP
jgi:hypothetical protein